MKKIFFAIFSFLIALPALAADPYGLDAAAVGAGLKKAEPAAVIGSIIGYALSFIGVIFLALILYGGYTWMTSFGNEQKVTKAKDLIVDAVIGLVIVIAAYTITNFVVTAILGSATATTPQ
jgi:uncharacterized membrane protein